MDKFETIQVDPNCVWYVLPRQAELPKEAFAEGQASSQRKYKARSLKTASHASLPTILDVALKNNWRVGKKRVRVIGGGNMPNPGQYVDLGGWRFMQAADYNGIVPQDALDRIRILSEEGVQIKGIMIADDLRRYKLRKLELLAQKVSNRIRAIDWQKIRTATVKCARGLASVTIAVSAAIVGKLRKKANEIDWNEAKAVLGESLKTLALVTVCVAGVVLALPVIAVAAVPAAAISIDPWLIVIDEADRWWCIAEWWD